MTLAAVECVPDASIRATPTPGDPNENTYTTETLGGREFRYDSLRARYAVIRYNTPSTDRGTWTVAGDMHWTDYDGDIPYGDFDIEPGTLTRNEVTRYLGLAGQQAVTGGAETYYHGDQIGSTMATSDDNGDIAGHSGGTFAPIAYTAFGEFLDASGLAGGDPPSGHPRYAYAGAFGYETGGFGGDDRMLWRDGANPNLPPITLQHVGARWYQPEVGRFVQRDPIGIAGGINVYEYGTSNPNFSVDPDGQLVITVAVVGGAVVLVGGKLLIGLWEAKIRIQEAADIVAAEQAMAKFDRFPGYTHYIVCIRKIAGGLAETPGTFHGGKPGTESLLDSGS